ncbi:hypothetical protein [Olleya sp. HaHaR_3_96]|uniref:hypothetical protein n=1 Tax=Olleya sp. HaHaR_3_96 TaxID=2745560 RepID=UPI001C4FEF60|nr:hypothetical protein [Olleya sp. HaHaR_3_96]QXP59316.1 hypothetical protein H0I26_15525 [Olleya sp. HaHaR_3_96]
MKNSIEEIRKYYIPINFGYIKDGKLYKKAPFSVNIEMSAVIILIIMIVQGIFFSNQFKTKQRGCSRYVS